MNNKIRERRLAENQVVFRRHNEAVQKGFDAINKTAREEGEPPYNYDVDAPLHFNCECSDEACRERILLSLRDYNKIHASRDRFTVACGHELPDVEQVVATLPAYCVVQKYKQPPGSASTLNPTNLHNA